MKKALLLVLVAVSCSRPYDTSYDARVTAPTYKNEHPLVLADAAHHNRHTINGTYRPFAALLESDGYRVRKLKTAVAADSLKNAAVLVIPAAMGNDETNSTPAFTDAESDAIEAWVRDGGSLLVITDHYPFPTAVQTLLARFGVQVGDGMTFDSVNFDRASRDDSQLVFSRDNGLLADHVITRGVSRVVTFTGASLRAPAPAVSLLRLGATATTRPPHPHVTRSGGDVRVNVEFGPPVSAAGWSQAIALEHGRGRAVFTAEAAMLTAQRDADRRIGMNLPGYDNKQFAINILHWLTRANTSP